MRRSAMLVGFLLGLGPALGACGGSGGVVGPSRGSPLVFGGPSASVADTVIVGSWIHTENSVDINGAPRTDDDIWTFNPDGSALHSVLTRDALGTVLAQQDQTGRFAVQGNQVVVDLTDPIAGRIQMNFLRQGNTLILGGRAYDRRF